jgi:hypothetical protein
MSFPLHKRFSSFTCVIIPLSRRAEMTTFVPLANLKKELISPLLFRQIVRDRAYGLYLLTCQTPGTTDDHLCNWFTAEKAVAASYRTE